MEQIKSTAGQGLGIAGLIFGILAIPAGLIPCTFFLGVLFGISGIVLSIVALTQANRGNGPKALIISALICSIIGFSFAAAWGAAFSHKDFILREIFDDFRPGAPGDFRWDMERPDDFNFPESDTTENEESNPADMKSLTDTLRMLEGMEPADQTP